MLFAAVLLFVYPAGTPLLTAVLLWRARHRINPRDAVSEADIVAKRAADPTIDPLRQLFTPYKAHLYLFEVVDMYRRIILTGTLVVISSQPARAMIGMLVSVGFAAFYQFVNPYATRALNNLSFAATWNVAVIYIGGLTIVARPHMWLRRLSAESGSRSRS